MDFNKLAPESILGAAEMCKTKRHRCWSGLVVVLNVLVIAGTCSRAIADPTNWVITQLTDNTEWDQLPQISGSNVVWETSGGMIFLYDGTGTIELTEGSGYGGFYAQISGSNVVWTHQWGRILKVVFYDGTAINVLSDDSYPYNGNARISGSNVVWEGGGAWVGSDYEIFLYDGTTRIQLTDNSTDDRFPQISGSNIAWSGWDGNDWEVFLYDGSTITQLTDNSIDDAMPYGAVLPNPEEGGAKISGSNIVWEGWDGIQGEIFFYDGTTVTQLTNNSYHEGMPQISGSNVVWSGSDGSDYEIFFYDGTTITQITDNSYGDWLPQISGSNIVWMGEPDGNAEIFFATPKTNDPATLLEDLIYSIRFLNIQHGIANSLDGKLEAALQAIEDINDNNNTAAMNALNAFINAVLAQSGDKISEPDAYALIQMALETIRLLQNQ